MKKKIVLVIICLIVVFLVGLLFIIHKKSNTIILKKEEFIYELGEEISADVSNYIKDADSIKNITEYKIVTDDFKIVDKKLVINNDKPTVGNYSINIVYKNVSKKVVIKIVDTISSLAVKLFPLPLTPNIKELPFKSFLLSAIIIFFDITFCP